MPQSSTLDIGMDVHQESIAIAYVAQDHGAKVTDLGPLGTRQAAIDHLVFVYDARLCGDWLYRYLTPQG
jgi:hypothetical protein